MTASQKVHLLRCTSSLVIPTYYQVRLIPKDSRALHLNLFTLPSIFLLPAMPSFFNCLFIKIYIEYVFLIYYYGTRHFHRKI
jgi:hypothetical protein